uniref:Rubredoxin n=1 Tax=Anthurium amnicola TaxID=1678845 RepID=A0A1D1Y766_9ARAE
MAAFATARPTLSFHLQPPSPLQTRPTRAHFLFHLPNPKAPISSPSPHHIHLVAHHPTAIASVDVSKDDKPLSEQEDPPATLTQTADATPGAAATEEEGRAGKLDRRQLEERFAVLDTGIYQCRSCGYRYDQAVGDPSYPIPPGYSFEKLPDDWRCPTCGAAQSFFESKSVEIAGFAQNQQFGFGGNSLTSGQKATLIYGTLLFFFVLFLLGYFLQ